MHEASTAAIKALPLTAIKSSFLFGAIAPIPLISMPTLLRLANPQSAYSIINLVLSDNKEVSISARRI